MYNNQTLFTVVTESPAWLPDNTKAGERPTMANILVLAAAVCGGPGRVSGGGWRRSEW